MRRRIGNRRINRAPRENPKASRVTASESFWGLHGCGPNVRRATGTFWVAGGAPIGAVKSLPSALQKLPIRWRYRCLFQSVTAMHTPIFNSYCCDAWLEERYCCARVRILNHSRLQTLV